MSDVASPTAVFMRALPQDLEPYRQEAAKTSQEAFERQVPYPFLLYVRSQLWDRSLLKVRSGAGAKDGGGATRMVTYEFYEGGMSFLHSIRKRQSPKSEAGIVLGRDTGMDLVVPVPSISSTHAVFMPPPPGLRDGSWTVIDSGSSNGTWVRDERLARDKPCAIADGDYLRLGGNIIAWFLYPGRLWHVLRTPAELSRLIEV